MPTFGVTDDTSLQFTLHDDAVTESQTLRGQSHCRRTATRQAAGKESGGVLRRARGAAARADEDAGVAKAMAFPLIGAP